MASERADISPIHRSTTVSSVSWCELHPLGMPDNIWRERHPADELSDGDEIPIAASATERWVEDVSRHHPSKDSTSMSNDRNGTLTTASVTECWIEDVSRHPLSEDRFSHLYMDGLPEEVREAHFAELYPLMRDRLGLPPTYEEYCENKGHTPLPKPPPSPASSSVSRSRRRLPALPASSGCPDNMSVQESFNDEDSFDTRASRDDQASGYTDVSLNAQSAPDTHSSGDALPTHVSHDDAYASDSGFFSALSQSTQPDPLSNLSDSSNPRSALTPLSVLSSNSTYSISTLSESGPEIQSASDTSSKGSRPLIIQKHPRYDDPEFWGLSASSSAIGVDTGIDLEVVREEGDNLVSPMVTPFSRQGCKESKLMQLGVVKESYREELMERKGYVNKPKLGSKDLLRGRVGFYPRHGMWDTFGAVGAPINRESYQRTQQPEGALKRIERRVRWDDVRRFWDDAPQVKHRAGNTCGALTSGNQRRNIFRVRFLNAKRRDFHHHIGETDIWTKNR